MGRPRPSHDRGETFSRRELVCLLRAVRDRRTKEPNHSPAGGEHRSAQHRVTPDQAVLLRGWPPGTERCRNRRAGRGSLENCLGESAMKNIMTRRDALKLGTGVAMSASATPLLSSPLFATPAPTDDICFMRAVDLLQAIRAKKLSSREIMQAHLKQIQRVNPKVNAMVTMVPEDQLMAKATAADEALAKGKWLGPLHGLPI